MTSTAKVPPGAAARHVRPSRPCSHPTCGGRQTSYSHRGDWRYHVHGFCASCVRSGRHVDLLDIRHLLRSRGLSIRPFAGIDRRGLA